MTDPSWILTAVVVEVFLDPKNELLVLYKLSDPILVSQHIVVCRTAGSVDPTS